MHVVQGIFAAPRRRAFGQRAAAHPGGPFGKLVLNHIGLFFRAWALRCATSGKPRGARNRAPVSSGFGLASSRRSRDLGGDVPRNFAAAEIIPDATFRTRASISGPWVSRGSHPPAHSGGFGFSGRAELLILLMCALLGRGFWRLPGKSGGPSAFEPSLKIQRDRTHKRSSGSSPPVARL
jgi:hypothetical protein